MFTTIKSALQGVLQRANKLIASLVRYLSNAAHRRFVAVIVAMAAAHLLGKTLNADDVANAIELVIGGVGGAWIPSGSSEVQE